MTANARTDFINAYRVVEFVTLTGDGAPVCWPMSPGFENGKITFTTGYMYPTKARNAQRNPHVCALFSDPSGTGRSDTDPLVLVQGRAEVLDQDLQRNTERYVDWLLQNTPPVFSMMLRIPLARQLWIGYLTRIWLEVTPESEYVWERSAPPPESLSAIQPDEFTPNEPITLQDNVRAWAHHYVRPPVLSWVASDGFPAAARVGADLTHNRIAIQDGPHAQEGAPGSLLFHRYKWTFYSPQTSGFLIRGHFDASGDLIPERVLGFGGTSDDRGIGSLKVTRLLVLDYRRQLKTKLAREGRPLPRARPSNQS